MAAVPSIGRAATVASATDATERLYDRHHSKVYAFCLYQLGNRDDAAEASQTTFMQALTALQRGVDPTFELPWLIAIARNVCRSRWDAGKRRRRIELARDPYDLASIAPARETTELVGIQDALAALPEPQRRALVLREWHGLSYQEIADELGLTLSAVETLIFRGRRSLARELGADEKGKRSLGIGSLLGSVKSVAGGGLTAKVAVGVVAAVGIGVAASHELAGQGPGGRRALVEAGRTEQAPVTPVGTRATPATASAARRLSAATRPLVHWKPQVATAALGTHRRAQAPAAPPALVPAAGTPAPGTPTPTSSAPASPAGTVAPPVASAPGAPAPPRATTPPAPVPVPVTDAVPPVAGTAADAGGTVAGTADPVVTKATDTVGQVVTTATDATAPVVAAVTDTTAPVVATVTNTTAPVVTTVTNTTAPVITTVTNALPTPPAPVQAPAITVPPIHLP